MTPPCPQDAVGRLTELLERATPRPWRVDGDFLITDDPAERDMERVVIADLRYFTIPHGIANAALIVEAINALPSLLSTLQSLRAREDGLWRALEEAGSNFDVIWNYPVPEQDNMSAANMRQVAKRGGDLVRRSLEQSK